MQKQHKDDQKNLLEWTVFGLSLLLVASLLGYLSYQAIIFQPSSPNLQVTYQADPGQNAPYRYHLIIRNSGQQTAEEVQVELILEKEGQVVEKAAIQIPYAPQASKREGWVNFSKDPAQADTLYARVVSYKKP